MYENSVLECQDCGRVLRHLSMSEAQRVAVDPYGFIAYCDSCKRFQDDYMFGQCASCFIMKNIRIGETCCDSCRSTGGPRDLDPEPALRKSGPNSRPEE